MREFLQMIVNIFGFILVWVGAALAISVCVGFVVCQFTAQC